MHQTNNIDINQSLNPQIQTNLNSPTPLSTDLRLGASVGLLGSSAANKSWIIPKDFNGDRKSDIVWRNNQTGDLQIWLMDGSSRTTLTVTGMGQEWDFQIGDFNGDSKSDLFWRNYTTGENQVWLNNGNGSSFSKNNILRVNPKTEGEWYFELGDFNGDGKHDLMWRNYTDGRNAIWLMDGTSITGGFIYQLNGANLNYDFDIGDFNGDGKTDLFWRHGKTGENAVWLMNGLNIINSQFTITVNDFKWDYEIGDTNNDGKSDLIWNHRQTGDVALWQFDGIQVDARFVYKIPEGNWEMEIADFNGDGKSDLVWRNYQDNRVAVWEMDNFTFTGYFLQPTVGVGNTEEFFITDVNSDGKSDLFWRNYLSGDNRLWLLNGSQVNSISLDNLVRGWLSY